VVDDNRTSRRILNGMLKRWEMKSTSVADGEAALAQLAIAREAGAPYDLIVIDEHMPAMTGFDLVEAMRQRPDFATATVMMLTSTNYRRDVAHCRDLGIALTCRSRFARGTARGDCAAAESRTGSRVITHVTT